MNREQSPVTSDAPDTARPASFLSDLCTFPNGLSLLRIVLGVVFPWLPVSWRAPVVVLAALTDLFDGAVGRSFGMCSRTGRVLDPIADKVFVAGVVLTFLVEGTIGWGEMLLLAARDLVVIVGVLLGLGLRHWAAFGQLSPTILSKVTTAALFAYFAALLVIPEYRDLFFLPAACLSLASGAHYFWLFLTCRRSV